jgi:ATP-binding cassette subfamily B protein/subfamily B ATP-binding cassette protein MsbA
VECFALPRLEKEKAVTKGKSYSRLLRYTLLDKRGWALLFLATLGASAFGLLTPWPMKILIDHVLGQSADVSTAGELLRSLPGGATPRGLLLWVVAAGLAIFAVNNALDALLTPGWIRVGQKMVYHLAADLFAHIQRRSLLFHRRSSVGDLLSRISGDSWCIYKMVEVLLFTPMFAILTITGMVVVMSRLDTVLTLIAVLVAPCVVGLTFMLGKPIHRAARARREIQSRWNSHIHQTMIGIPVVQAYAQEDRQQQRFTDFTNDALRAQRRSTLIGSISGLTSGIAATLGTGVILWFGGRHVLEGRLSLGSLLVFLAYLGTLQGQLKALTGIYNALQETRASADRVLEILQVDAEVKDGPAPLPLPPVQGHIRLENVSYGYELGRPVLSNISLEVLPGQSMAIVGATGAGKTTLASLVPRFFDPWQGRVLIDGLDVRDVSLKDLRRQVGLVFQEPYLFPFTIAQNIAFGHPEASADDIEVAARAANIHDFIQTLDQDYDTPVGQRGMTLSGGEQQRLSIARALLKNAPILILDEPTSALDAKTERLFLEALVRLMRGRTTLIIAHRLSTIRHADRIVVLQEGRVVEEGNHRELLARNGVYARMCRTQEGGSLEVKGSVYA